MSRRPPEVIAYCHPKDLAWMEAGLRGDLDEAVRLFQIRRQLDALPSTCQDDGTSSYMEGQPGILFPAALDTFAGVNHVEAGTYSNVWTDHPQPLTLAQLGEVFARFPEEPGYREAAALPVSPVVPMKFEGEKP